MNAPSLLLWFAVLLLSITGAGFCAIANIALLTVNRYRLDIRARKGDTRAAHAQVLLQRPNAFISALLVLRIIFNTLTALSLVMLLLSDTPSAWNILQTSLLMALALGLSETLPKALGALYPERWTLRSATLLWHATRLMRPLILISNRLTRLLLRILGVSTQEATQHSINPQELRNALAEASAMIPRRHQRMLGAILDLENATVEDVMVPRNEIFGIDLTDAWSDIRNQIIGSEHTRIPLFDGSIDHLCGVVHLRRVVRLAAEDTLKPETLTELAREPYFIPAGTPLNQQLLNFQNRRRRIGFVVDEYGDIQGLVTIEDILEEIIGQFTADPGTRIKNVYADSDGSYRVTGSVTLRNLNRGLGWKLPTQGPKTVNGLLIETLESMPQAGARAQINGYAFEVLEIRANAIRATRIWPPNAAPAPSVQAAEA